MDIAIGFLTFGTLGFFAAFGYISARATEKRRNEKHPPSSLASTTPRHVPATVRSGP